MDQLKQLIIFISLKKTIGRNGCYTDNKDDG
jgi:hypothetical protein